MEEMRFELALKVLQLNNEMSHDEIEASEGVPRKQRPLHFHRENRRV